MPRTLNAIIKEGIFREPFLAVYRAVYKFRRFSSGRDKRTSQRYFTQNETRKLQLGCGHHLLDGWLDSDYFPTSNEVIHLDATSAFPFEERIFDYVYSEHMIEHVSYGAGHSMLQESWRVLKDGGKIRISTPDLAFLIALCAEKKTDMQKEYIRHSSRAVNAPFDFHTFVINNFVRAWRHMFIYDEEVLRYSLEQAGFVDITRRALNVSEDEALRNLENETRMPAGFLKLETLTLEGTKRLAQAKR